MGKVKGQLSLRPVATSVVRERMGKAPAVQSGRTLPMGRCASPPWVGVIGGGGLLPVHWDSKTGQGWGGGGG